MVNLALRSAAVLGLLFGMLFAVLVAVFYHFDIAWFIAVPITIFVVLAQYTVSPWIIQLLFKIRWQPLEAVDEGLADFLRDACSRAGVPVPRFGIIDDDNPNAFTFGHYPGDARLVITRGILTMLDEEEQKAVLAHELGHIVHWDFVVMTVAAMVPLILYVVWRSTLGERGRSGKNSGHAALVGIAALVFYWISQYVVLFLSRVREYYADQYSAQTLRNPNPLATGLMKIAYGLARAEKREARQEPAMAAGAERQSIWTRPLSGTRRQAGPGRQQLASPLAGLDGARMMGIFDPTFGSALALAAAGSYSSTQRRYDPVTIARAMEWDIFNPWGTVCELQSSHPLPARRIRHLERIALRMGIAPALRLPERPQQGYWREFWGDLLVYALPIIGLLVGSGIGIVLTLTGSPALNLAGIGAVFLCLGAGMLARVVYSYPKRSFAGKTVTELVREVRVSNVRAIPARLSGTVIGRGIPGLWWSEDLVIQDETGFMRLDYRQPLGLLQFLFGLFRAESFIGERIEVEGWYRRFPMPYLELWHVRRPNGEIHTCHNWAVRYWGSIVAVVVGLGMTALGLVLSAAAPMPF